MSGEGKRVVVLGGSGHAAVVIELLLEAGWSVEGFLDPQSPPGAAIGPVRCLGDDDELPRLKSAGVSHAIVAIGDNARRQDLARKIGGLGFALANAIHRTAQISRTARLGQGIAMMAHTAVNARTTIGDNAIINTGATVDHDCRVGQGVHIAPGARLAGCVVLGECVLVGVGAIVGRGRALNVGDTAVIGAGALVLADVPAAAQVAGNPARPLRHGGTT